MRILILGNNYSAKKFFELFQKNKENIVFSSFEDTQNTDFNDISDVVELICANEINLVLITDEKFIQQGFQKEISEQNVSVFAPSKEADEICYFKSLTKKFAHKNKILTPRFQTIEKPLIALDYIKSTLTAQAIKPDTKSFREGTLFCETFRDAQKIVNNFFESGNKKIVIEDYIEGKNINIWTLTDGYNAKIIGTSAIYQNNVALFEPDFVGESLKEKLFNEAIMPAIEGLGASGEEYIGILGFDFILTSENKAYLVGLKSFFDDLNTDFFINAFNFNWAQVFDRTIVGDVFLNFDFEREPQFMLALRQNEEIKFISAKTKTNLKRYLSELDFDLSEYYEAEKLWKS